MRSRETGIIIGCLACILTASATLWHYVFRAPPSPQKNAMPIPWVQTGLAIGPGPTNQWPVSKLRSCAADTRQSVEQRAQAMCLLAQARDWESVEVLIAQLDDPAPLVRGRAAAAIRHILGTDFNYRAADDRPTRLASIKGIRRYWESRKANPPVIRLSDASN